MAVDIHLDFKVIDESSLIVHIETVISFIPRNSLSLSLSHVTKRFNSDIICESRNEPVHTSLGECDLECTLETKKRGQAL